jgi:hypothetical protein
MAYDRMFERQTEKMWKDAVGISRYYTGIYLD